MTDLISVVENLDFVVSLATDHVHPEEVYAARTVADRARSRAGHLGSTLVLALVGGTGSGKSSLLNAIAGEPVASASAVRPHTTEPLAWIPEGAEPSLIQLLNRLDIERRVEQTRFSHLAVLDMMDVDSVTREHRYRVEQLLPEVDVIVWVLDPVKYADVDLHREFIAPLAGASDRLMFVLNQIDRLDGPSLSRVRIDLGRRLVADGIAEPTVFVVAADPPDGTPRGVAELTAHLDSMLDEKRIQVGRILDEARRAARSIAAAAGITVGGSLEFEQRWKQLRAAVVTEILGRRGSAGFEAALQMLEEMVLRLSTEAGGGFGLRIRQVFRAETIERELRAAVDGSTAQSDVSASLDRELQDRFGGPIRTILWERASLQSVVAGLTIDATAVDSGLGRSI